jgi:hypothetical protein
MLLIVEQCEIKILLTLRNHCSVIVAIAVLLPSFSTLCEQLRLPCRLIFIVAFWATGMAFELAGMLRTCIVTNGKVIIDRV